MWNFSLFSCEINGSLKQIIEKRDKICIGLLFFNYLSGKTVNFTIY